jgi:hypothetical protein
LDSAATVYLPLPINQNDISLVRSALTTSDSKFLHWILRAPPPPSFLDH